MSDDSVLVRERDAVLTVTLNRPKKLNAVNHEMAMAFDEHESEVRK